jgi:hypothetical protein
LDTYGFTFKLFRGNYGYDPNRNAPVVNPQEVTSSYVSATFAGSNFNRSGNGKQFIVAYTQWGTVAVGGVVVTLP